MSVLINSRTKVITRGFAGKNGAFSLKQALAYWGEVGGGASRGATDATRDPIAARQTFPRRRGPVTEATNVSYADRA